MALLLYMLNRKMTIAFRYLVLIRSAVLAKAFLCKCASFYEATHNIIFDGILDHNNTTLRTLVLHVVLFK